MLVPPRWWTGAGYANTFRPHQPGHCPSETSVLGTRWCESCSVPFKTMVGEAWVGGSWHHPSLGTSLSREAGRGPVLVTAPHALAFGAFLVPFCLFVWCFSKYSPKKSHPCSMQSQEHLAWHPLPMARWPGAAGERCAPGVLVPSLSSKKNTLGEFPLYQTHFHQAHIKGHRFILF